MLCSLSCGGKILWGGGGHYEDLEIRKQDINVKKCLKLINETKYYIVKFIKF